MVAVYNVTQVRIKKNGQTVTNDVDKSTNNATEIKVGSWEIVTEDLPRTHRQVINAHKDLPRTHRQVINAHRD